MKSGRTRTFPKYKKGTFNPVGGQGSIDGIFSQEKSGTSFRPEFDCRIPKACYASFFVHSFNQT